MRKRLCCVFTLPLFSVMMCHGNAVEWGVAVFGYKGISPGIYGFGVILPTNGAGTDLEIKVTTTPWETTLKNTLESYTLGYGIVLLQVDYNTLIDQDLLLNSSDPFFNTYGSSGERISQTDVKISLYETVYLAFAWGGLGSDLCGWVALTYDDTGVHLVDSAMDMTRQGIYAGTGITVPESSTALLALSGLAVLCLRRRKRQEG